MSKQDNPDVTSTKPVARPLSNFFVEGFFVLFWISANGMSVSILDKTEWWLGFQFFYLGAATNLTYYAISYYKQVLGDKSHISWNVSRMLFLNTGVILTIAPQVYANVTTKQFNFMLNTQYFEQPSFTTWFAYLPYMDRYATFFVTIQFIGLICIVISAVWLLIAFSVVLFKNHSLVSFPMSGYASLYGLSCLAGSSVFDMINGYLLLQGVNLPLDRAINMVFLMGWLATPFIITILGLAPTIFIETSNEKAITLGKDWAPLLLWGMTLYLIAQTSWLFIDPARVPFLIAIGIIGFPSIIIATTITSLCKPVIMSVAFHRLTLLRGLIWIAVVEIVTAAWIIFVDSSILVTVNNRVTVTLLVTGLQTAAMALLVYLVQSIRYVGMPKSTYLPTIQLVVYTFFTGLIFIDGLDLFELPSQTTLLSVMFVGTVLFTPAVLGYPKTPAGEKTEREAIWQALKENKTSQKTTMPMMAEPELLDEAERQQRRRQHTQAIYFDLDLIS